MRVSVFVAAAVPLQLTVWPVNVCAVEQPASSVTVTEAV